MRLGVAAGVVDAGARGIGAARRRARIGSSEVAANRRIGRCEAANGKSLAVARRQQRGRAGRTSAGRDGADYIISKG